VIRVGTGYDVHAFADERPLVVGGVTIPNARGLSGHSDADVLSHALIDALLGAANLGDLGERFPATERWRGASSIEMLAETGSLIADAGWRVENVDATVVAEAPKLSGYREDMAANIARALQIDVAAVSVKSTTTDGLGFTGRGEGMAALATVLVSSIGRV
jgi:2-C-methyl-D-erythritol 2,4-cyclodiphosphate synthase